MPTHYLGIDLGTTASKAAVLDAAGKVVARSRVSHGDALSARQGRVDAHVWARSVQGACRELGPDLDGVAGIALAVQSPTVFLLDGDCEPVTEGLTWAHPALEGHCRAYALVCDESDRSLIGNTCAPATAMAAAYGFFREQEPLELRSAQTMGLVGTWIGAWLTGEIAIDPTQAAYTGVLTTTRSTWAWIPSLLDRLGIPADLMPEVRPSLSVLGSLRRDTAKLLGLRPGIPVLVGSADTPAASYALGSDPNSAPLLIMGTTHVVSRCLATPDTRSLAMQRPDVVPGRWLINGATNGGQALAHAAALLGYGSSPNSVRNLIADASRADPKQVAEAPIYIPHVTAERGPLWLPEARTAMVGLTATTDRASAARGVLEGVLLGDKMVLDHCVSARQPDVLLAGTHTKDQLMPQLLADVLGRTIHLVEETHLPAVGAALMCLEVFSGTVRAVPSGPGITPRPQWRDLARQRAERFADTWTAVVGRMPLPTQDGSADTFGDQRFVSNG